MNQRSRKHQRATGSCLAACVSHGNINDDLKLGISAGQEESTDKIKGRVLDRSGNPIARR